MLPVLDDRVGHERHGRAIAFLLGNRDDFAMATRFVIDRIRLDGWKPSQSSDRTWTIFNRGTSACLSEVY